MRLNEFLDKLVEEVPNFQIWSHGRSNSEEIRYSWKAKSSINQWEYSDKSFDTVEETLLNFLSQVTRFTLERNE